MAEVVQYSVIILRDDQESLLPGAPLTLSPLVFEPALDANEIVFTQDTARMFVGHSPSIGQPNFRRTTFPYQNIEVLTEASVDTFNTMVGNYRKQESDKSYFYTALPATSTMAPIVIPLDGNPTNQFRFNDISSLTATVEYAGYDNNGKPVKMGELRVMYGSGVSSPACIDNGNDLGAPLLTFSASVAGPTGSQYIVMNYQYVGSGNVSLRLRYSRPTYIGVSGPPVHIVG
jgi:hypothetical protein